jgi:hypothetical protein
VTSRNQPRGPLVASDARPFGILSTLDVAGYLASGGE